jgi:uncharacterized protein
MRSLAFSINLSLILATASLLSGTCTAADTADITDSTLVAIPPVAQVTDLTNTLTAEVQSKLNTELVTLAKEKGAQVVVLIVPSTLPEDIAAYSMRVFDAWKLGRKGIDDGVIILVAKKDHQMRIAVGRGLEGAIPDVYAKRIVADIMAPAFKSDDFAGGIDQAVDAVSKLVRGEALPAPKAREPVSAAPFFELAGAAIGALVLYGLLYWLSTELVAVGLTSTVAGALTGGFASSILIGVGTGLGLALLLWLIGRLIASDGGGGALIADLLSGDSGSGGGSSSGRSSSDDSGSFSGGGGDSAGGGASGSW